MTDDATVVSAWKNTNETTISELLLRSKGCLNLYNNLNKGMGRFFFFFMSLNQIALIFYIFITITTVLDGKSDISSVTAGIGFGCGTIGLTISVVSFTLALDRYLAKCPIVSSFPPKLALLDIFSQMLPKSGTIGKPTERDVDQLQR